MTIHGWICFAMFALIVGFIGIALSCAAYKPGIAVLERIITVALIIAIFLGMRWYFNNTASGSRALVDERSNLNKGIERVVNVYTADGEIIAQYEGKIDIDTNDGGYVKFDFEGKRYIYYNCFIETIAEIGG